MHHVLGDVLFFFNEPSTAALFLFLLYVWIVDSFLKQENNMGNFSGLTDPDFIYFCCAILADSFILKMNLNAAFRPQRP